MELYDKAWREIKDLGEKGLSIGELAKKLNINTKSEKRMLSKTIKKLMEAELVIAKGKNKIKPVTKELVRGKLRGNRRGFAFLIRDDGKEDVFIPNKSLNGAMHGDTVLAGLTGESEGVVLSVEKRGILHLTGTFIRQGKHGYVIPDNDNYFKDVFIPSDGISQAASYAKVVVQIDDEPQNKRPTGKIIDILGMAGDTRTEVISILRNYEFNDKFPPQVVREAQKIKYVEQERKDSSKLLTITIDGEDAQDFDDAISVERTPRGYRLYVHIADVAFYVKQSSIIDKEALKRATSVYFPGKAFPMLPESISNGVCSLKPHEKKFAVSVVMDIDREGEVIKAEFFESLIMSDYSLTYDEVTKILEGDKPLLKKYAQIADMLNISKELAGIIRNKRRKEGTIDFGSRECKIILDDKGEVQDILPFLQTESHSIIEQFMILANRTVADFISKKNVPSIYRVHEEAGGDKLNSFVQFIKGLGYRLDLKEGIKPKIFSNLLEEVKGKDEEPIINKVMLRTMQKAVYSTKNSGHFGLALSSYCHFTAPIRRYPDLMVHRVLKAIINGKANETFMGRYKELCQKAAIVSTEREIAAANAEREVEDYYKALYMKKHIGQSYKGLISGVIGAGIFVILENTVEGFVSIDDLPDDRYEFDEKNYCMAGIKYKFSLCDKIQVKIKAGDPFTRNIDMVFDGDENNHIKR